MARSKHIIFVVLLASLVLSSAANTRTKDAQSATRSIYSNPPEGTRKTIKGEDGDIVDCVDIHKQPSLLNPNAKPLKRNNKLLSKGYDPLPPTLVQSWHKSGKCPVGTIPLRRQLAEAANRVTEHKYGSLRGIQIDYSQPNVVTRFGDDNSSYKIYALEGVLNIWEPKLENPGDMSKSSIIFASNQLPPFYGTGYPQIEVGWKVSPADYGDYKPRLFIDPTPDDGFMQTSSRYAIGCALQPSTYNGNQSELHISLHLDDDNWRLAVEGFTIGYWELYAVSVLSEGADMVQYGGAVSSFGRGLNTLTEMGSGHFPGGSNIGLASYIRGMRFNGSFPNTSEKTALQTSVSTIPSRFKFLLRKIGPDTYFFFGGPGSN